MKVGLLEAYITALSERNNYLFQFESSLIDGLFYYLLIFKVNIFIISLFQSIKQSSVVCCFMSGCTSITMSVGNRVNIYYTGLNQSVSNYLSGRCLCTEF